MTNPTPSVPPRPLDIQPELLERMQAAIEDIREGRMVILVDDEDRENEGDLTMAAEAVTPEAINFMAKFGRGLICVTMTGQQVERLELPMMTAPKGGRAPLGTAFTVSIEAKHGVTTGISAADRARTIQVAIDPEVTPEDLVTPGHVFPLRARRGGVLVRAGQTEGSVDLARLAGLGAAGVICEIMNDDGSMARMPDLESFAAEHSLRIVTIADLIAYRLQTEKLVRRLDEHDIVLDQTGTPWHAIVYEATLEQRQFLALVKGQLCGNEAVLCRMHSGSTIADTFASTRREGGKNLQYAIDRIEDEGRGVVVYLPPKGDLRHELALLKELPEEAKSSPVAAKSSPVAAKSSPVAAKSSPPKSSPAATDAALTRPHGGTLREYGLGAQVLRELGLHRIRLITSNPRKIAGIHGYGLDVVESVPLAPG